MKITMKNEKFYLVDDVNPIIFHSDNETIEFDDRKLETHIVNSKDVNTITVIHN